MNKKTTTLSILLVAGFLAIGACNSGSTSKVENAADTMAARVDTALSDMKQGAEKAAANVKDAFNGNADSNFVVKAALSNNEELKVLQAGAENGTSKELKAHAKMMITDHKKLGTKVMAYATKKGYPLPAGDDGKGDNDLSDLNKKDKGSDWDKAWTDWMASAHKDAIDMFEKGNNDVKDPELKSLISDALPTLHAHYDMMKQMQDKMGK